MSNYILYKKRIQLLIHTFIEKKIILKGAVYIYGTGNWIFEIPPNAMN